MPFYTTEPSPFLPGGVYAPEEIPEGALIGVNGEVLGVTDPNYSGDHSCFALKDSHVEEAKELLLEQFSEAVRLKDLLESYILPVQTLEDVSFDAVAAMQFDTATEHGLTNIGEFLGLVRGNISYGEFALCIAAKILANKSLGRIDDLIEAFRAIVPDTGGRTIDVQEGTKWISLELTGNDTGLTTVSHETIFQIIKRAIKAGVAFFYRYFSQPSTATVFTFSALPTASQFSTTQGSSDVAKTTGGYLAGVFRK